MIKRKLSLFLCFVLVLVVAACGSNESASNESNESTEAHESTEELSSDNNLPPLPDNIKENGKLVIGVKDDWPPYGFIDENGKHAGFEIDFAKKVAELAFGNPDALELVSVTSSNRIPFLNSEKVDILISTLGETEERKQEVDYSIPYFGNGHMLLVPEDSEIDGIEDLEDKNVIVVGGSSGGIALEKLVPTAKISKYDSPSEAFRSLKDGRGDALAHDDSLVDELSKDNSGFKVVGDPFEPIHWGVGVRKGEEELLNWVNAAIEEIKEEDLFYEWFNEWLPESDFALEYVPRSDD